MHGSLSLSFFTDWMLFLMPNQQSQSIEGKADHWRINDEWM